MFTFDISWRANLLLVKKIGSSQGDHYSRAKWTYLIDKSVYAVSLCCSKLLFGTSDDNVMRLCVILLTDAHRLMQ